MTIPIGNSSSENETKKEENPNARGIAGKFSADPTKPVYFNRHTGMLSNEPGEGYEMLTIEPESVALFGNDGDNIATVERVTINPQDYSVGMVAVPSAGWGTHTYTRTLNMLKPIKSFDRMPIEGVYEDVLTGLCTIDEAYEDVVPRNLKLIGRDEPLMCEDVIPYSQLGGVTEISLDELPYLLEAIGPEYEKAVEASKIVNGRIPRV